MGANMLRNILAMVSLLVWQRPKACTQFGKAYVHCSLYGSVTVRLALSPGAHPSVHCSPGAPACLATAWPWHGPAAAAAARAAAVAAAQAHEMQLRPWPGAWWCRRLPGHAAGWAAKHSQRKCTP
eukprot:scaffold322067_cov22-Tisochrysis_lutea.AAC.1